MQKKYDIGRLNNLRGSAGFVHEKFGDLNRSDCVKLCKFKDADCNFNRTSPYFVHLSITGRCNARCKGCINSAISFKDNAGEFFLSQDADTKPQRDANAIIDLTKNIKGEIAVCFYGGEPLLLPEKIYNVIKNLEKNNHRNDYKYMVYTNGLLISKVIEAFPELADKVWLWSVSIDGKTEQHNTVREGTDLNKIHENLSTLKSIRSGDVLMWSTLREGQSLWNCFEEFLWLYENGMADHFFWHWVETDRSYEDFEGYVENYENHLRKIMDVYLEHLATGRLLSMVHINELILFALCGTKRGTSACGVELAKNFDIAGGKIMPCSDMGFESAIGQIAEDGSVTVKHANLKHLVDYREDLGCDRCGVGSYCGGRCPVEALNSKADRLIQYCQLMRIHVAVICDYIDQIKSQMTQADISLQDIYDKSAYLAQFTDVTP